MNYKSSSARSYFCVCYISMTQHNSFDLSLIKQDSSSLIPGDLNGHCQMWVYLQSQSQRGDEFLDWILNNDLHILHDGSATQTSRIT